MAETLETYLGKFQGGCRNCPWKVWADSGFHAVFFSLNVMVFFDKWPFVGRDTCLPFSENWKWNSAVKVGTFKPFILPLRLALSGIVEIGLGADNGI